jgi:hypothetical protein
VGVAFTTGVIIAAVHSLCKWGYRKVKPIITANRIKKLEKEGFVVRKYEAEEEIEDADFVAESEVVEDESEE